MSDLIRRVFGLPTKADSLAIAQGERLARAEREIRRSCRHECVSCNYFTQVYEITSSTHMLIDVADLKADHVDACQSGVPNSYSCTEALRFKTP